MGSQATVHQLHQGRRNMPSKNGFVSLWRDIKDQPWYKNSEYKAVFIHLLVNASHSATQVKFRGSQVNVLPGQTVTSLTQLECDLGIDRSIVRRAIKKFESLGQVSLLSVGSGKRKCTVFTLKNWGKFQQKNDTQSDTVIDTLEPTPIKGLSSGADTSIDTQSDTQNNNVNNNKIVSKDTCQNSDEFSPAQQQNVPHQEIVNLFGEILPSLPQPKKITAARRKSIKARHVNDLKSDLNNWKKYFTYIRDNCQWMTSGQYNVDFDYVIRQSTFVKILEGAKDDRK